MPLVPAGELVREAFKKGYAVPAINTQGGNYDLVRALAETAAEERSPLILQAYESNTPYYGLGWLPFLAERMSRQFGIPLAVHLDHGSSVETVREAVELGYTSVMIDYSARPLEENIEAVNHVIAFARSKGVTVEAEIGRLGRAGEGTGGEGDDEEGLADPDEVIRFLSEAPVDMLAVGIGNAHGFYRGEPRIRMDLLRRIRCVSGRTPLVLHGTTGIPEDVVGECIRNGMAKINYGTLLRAKMLEYITAAVNGPFDHRGHVWRVCEHVHTRLKEDIRPIIRLLNSGGR
jgi:ketose-bisphosphate aldolase